MPEHYNQLVYDADYFKKLLFALCRELNNELWDMNIRYTIIIIFTNRIKYDNQGEDQSINDTNFFFFLSKGQTDYSIIEEFCNQCD